MILDALERGELSKEEIQKMRQEHIKEYKTAHQKNYKNKSFRKELVFNLEEYHLIDEEFKKAKKKNKRLRLGTFLKSQILTPSEGWQEKVKNPPKNNLTI